MEKQNKHFFACKADIGILNIEAGEIIVSQGADIGISAYDRIANWNGQLTCVRSLKSHLQSNRVKKIRKLFWEILCRTMQFFIKEQFRKFLILQQYDGHCMQPVI